MKKRMEIKQILKHRFAINFYYWLVFFLILFFSILYFSSAGYAFRASFGVVFPLIFPVYLHFLLLDKYFKQRRYLKYALLLILLIVASGAFAQYLINILLPSEEDVVVTFLNPLVIILITSGARYYRQGFKLQLQLHEAQAKQYKAELDLLKYQINPHFFFNTLNNLFSMARKQKDQSTAKGIAKLSHLMRYMIYDCSVEKINLAKEIEQINNLIELQKLRFFQEDDIEIKFNINGQPKNHRIIPMLLIPFVENAFKHGISLKKKSVIDINLSFNENQLLFSVKNNINRFRHDRDDQNSGVGLANVKRRLELLYPKTHFLKIENNNETFEVVLKLKL